MGVLDGQVVPVTGAARGQGRSRAVRFAEEDADVIAVDLCAQVGTVPYPLATPDDLAETVKLVEALDRRAAAFEADVRDAAALRAAADTGAAEPGGIDIVLANAGIASFAQVSEMTEDTWRDMIDINLTGVFHTVSTALPHLRPGGSMVLTGSTASPGSCPSCTCCPRHGSSRRTSPTPACSSPRTRPGSSPVWRCPSTPAG
jgi:NAD(P)-dependent dehydrogenase (short-subunit alcohol dehydrogenase family)